jgi:hypothetical protein
MDPSDYVRGTFRQKDAGVGTMSSNSHSATGDFFIDRARLGDRLEWDHEAPNEWGGMGKEVLVKNSIMQNVRRAMGDIGACSSNKRHAEPNEPVNAPGMGCCVPPSPYYGRHNHLLHGRRKNEE